MRHYAILLLVCLVMVSDTAAEEWEYDVLHLKSGASFPGLIVSESPERLVFRRVLRRPGVRTVTRELTVDPVDVESLDRLSEEARQFLRRKLAQLDETGEQERRRTAAVTLTAMPWPGSDRPGLHYQGTFFDLTSNASEELVRLAVVRLEEVFAAYVANLGSRRQPKNRTKVLLYRSVEEYRQWQQRRGVILLNSAYFDAQRNEIHIASALERLETEWAKVRQKEQAQLRELAEHEQKLRRHYDGKPPAASVAQLRQLRRQVQALSQDNETTMERLREAFFATLRHEAFHAYVEAFVYPEREGGMPRWLNEGLAQIFETALVETGELRVGHVDPQRLAEVQGAVKQQQLLPLRELLRASTNAFQVGHTAETWATDRTYLTAWALAYYLTFERKLLGTDALHQYVHLHSQDADRVRLLERFVGQPLAELEPVFHAYLLRLRSDGSPKPAR